MTDKLEGDMYVTLHIVWPIFLSLFGTLAENDDDLINEIEGDHSLEAKMKRLGRQYMLKNQNDFQPTFYHKSMTFLNPAMKKLSLIPLAERLKLHQDIETYIQEHFTHTSNTVDLVQDNIQPRRVSENFLESFMSFDEGQMAPESEISRYILQPITCEVILQKWWLDHSAMFPNLSKLFLKLSCVPATSASSERNFSTCGNIVTDKRSLILPENVNNIILVRNKV